MMIDMDVINTSDLALEIKLLLQIFGSYVLSKDDVEIATNSGIYQYVPIYLLFQGNGQN